MVRGLDKFKEAFKDYTGSYIIIGGSACDISLGEAGLQARATKDIDMILVVEALTPEYGKVFWDFVKAGGYQQRERSDEKLEYFRFLAPSDKDYPEQIELFARIPDLFELPEDAKLTPIPIDDNLTSLSAILMDTPFYEFTVKHSKEENGVHIADSAALIVLKAKAYLNFLEDKEKGLKIDSRTLKKHKMDVFRVALLLTEETMDVPDELKETMTEFVEKTKADLPDAKWFRKEVGAGEVSPEQVLTQIGKTFGL